MDVDFDDILQEFEREVRPSDFNLVEFKRSDMAALTQSWINERMAPDLLEYQDQLIERMLVRVRQQIEFIEVNSIELQTQERDIKLQLMIVESELDRVNFLIRSYLRTRLSKIDKYTVYIRNDEDMVARLSESETRYMENHFNALIELYNSLFLSQLPPQLQALDDTGGGISMIEEPPMDKSVFIQVLKDIPDPIIIGAEEIDLEANSIYILRYSAVKFHINSGDVILI